MRILHVLTQKPFATGSGIYLSGIMGEFAQRHEQYLICGLNAREDGEVLNARRDFKMAPVLFQQGDLPFDLPGMSNVMPYTSRRYDSLTEAEAAAMTQAFGAKLEEAVAQFKPDIVLCQHLYLISAFTAEWVHEQYPELPVIAFCHGSDLRQYRSTDRWREMIKAGIGRFSAVVATHQEQAQDLAELFGYPMERIRILGSGYNSQIFKEDPAVDREASPLRIVYTGKLSRAKGVPELLRACDMVGTEQSIHLTLIGGGGDPTESEAIRQYAQTREYPVSLTGQITQPQAAAIYQRSHIFVLPSYYEGMPLVVPEALACGMKAAVTALPGFEQWLNPFSDRVRLIPRPVMASLDEPTEEGRVGFVRDIARAISELAQDPASLSAPDMREMSWRGLADRISVLMKELSGLD